MMTNFRYTAQYDCSTYGSSTYNNGQVCAAQTTNGNLAYTGLDIALPLAAGLLLIGVAIVLIVRHLRQQKSSTSSS